MTRSYSDQAIILKRINFGEADRLLTVYSKKQGKIKLIAKGIRKLSSRKKGHLELFNHTKLSCAKGKNLDIITEAQTIQNFSKLKQNLNAVRIAYLFSELIDQLTAENQTQEDVFDLTLDYFKKLNLSQAPKNIILQFEKDLLTLLGFGLPAKINRQSLENHILSITEKSLNSKKIR